MSSQPKLHPAAKLFPAMSDDEFTRLKEDIKRNGQNLDIVYYKGQLLDGRHRLRACEELGIEPDACDLEEDIDPWNYAVSSNLHRRHLTTSQRSLIAARMATLKRGSNQHAAEGPSNDESSSRDEAASLLNVSTASVDRAKVILDKGSKQLVDAVEAGDVSVGLAYKLAKSGASKTEQSDLVKQGKEAIKEFLDPPSDELEYDDVEPADDTSPAYDTDVEYEDMSEADDLVSTWEVAEERLTILRKMFQKLQPHEVEAVRTWLEGAI